MIETTRPTEPETALRREIVRRIVAVADPDRIIIFGSRARGDHRADGDVDVLVIQESSEPRHKRSGPVYGALADLPREVDVLVYTPREVEEWSAVDQAFVTTTVREGIIVYERPA